MGHVVTTRPRFRRNRGGGGGEEDGWDAWKRDKRDLAALGYKRIESRPVRRRVVPLLEWVETNMPRGHVLSLQLSHQMDIDKTGELEEPRGLDQAYFLSTPPQVSPARFFGRGTPSVSSSSTTTRDNRSTPVTSSTGVSSSRSSLSEEPFAPGRRAYFPSPKTPTMRSSSGSAVSSPTTVRRTSQNGGLWLRNRSVMEAFPVAPPHALPLSLASGTPTSTTTTLTRDNQSTSSTAATSSTYFSANSRQ